MSNVIKWILWFVFVVVLGFIIRFVWNLVKQYRADKVKAAHLQTVIDVEAKEADKKANADRDARVKGSRAA